MKQLSKATLSEIVDGIESPKYSGDSISSGIVHFGTGNFHRAHQAVYCDALLNEGETRWGITGVSLRSAAVRDKLAPQDFLYTQATLGSRTAYRVIGSIQNILVAPEDPFTVISTVADSRTQLVTTTITEKGYYLSNNQIDRAHPDIAHDLASLDLPKTTYGFLAAALLRREADSGAPLTVLCCDNIQAGGEHLRSGVEMLLQHHSSATLGWTAQNVSYCSSMVDRVTPTTTELLKQDVATQLSLIDDAPIAAEPFTQWVIEDRFAGARPPFDRVGALFVDDIKPYERVKLRFLNAGHSMLAALGYLAGDEFVHEALQRPTLAHFTEQALKRHVLPVIPIPSDVDPIDYIDQILNRFRNVNLPYAVLQVGSDSSQKIQQRWLPSVDEALSLGRDTSYFAFALAAWVSFIRKALANDDLSDPLTGAFSDCLPSPGVNAFLALAGVDQFKCLNDLPFIEAVSNYHELIERLGVEQALKKAAFT